jgi:hypothetical protein
VANALATPLDHPAEPLAEAARDLDTIYRQLTDPESARRAAFTAEDQ